MPIFVIYPFACELGLELFVKGPPIGQSYQGVLEGEYPYAP